MLIKQVTESKLKVALGSNGRRYSVVTVLFFDVPIAVELAEGLDWKLVQAWHQNDLPYQKVPHTSLLFRMQPR